VGLAVVVAGPAAAQVKVRFQAWHWNEKPVFFALEEFQTVTLGVAFSVGEFIIKWPMLTAASLIGSLPTIILYLFLQR
jgi:ABC-type glycerol-3-phosphate transport system permease component